MFCAALIGAGLGFLWFNAPPAAVFMGDTGNLSLGGALGAVAVATKHEIVLLIVGGLFVVETVSGHHPGVLVQAHRQPRLPDGAAAPSFREERLGRTDHRDSVLDHLDDPGAGRPGDIEDPMTENPRQPLCRLPLRRPRPRPQRPSAAHALAAMGAAVVASDDNSHTSPAEVAVRSRRVSCSPSAISPTARSTSTR